LSYTRGVMHLALADHRPARFAVEGRGL